MAWTPTKVGAIPGFRVENTDSGEKHSRPDHHMLMPRLFIHLPRRRFKNGDQTRMIVSDLKESANPPGGKRGGSPCAPVHMTRIMPDQHPSGPGTGAGDRRGAPPIHAPGPGAQGAGRRETILSGNPAYADPGWTAQRRPATSPSSRRTFAPRIARAFPSAGCCSSFHWAACRWS